MMFGKKTGTKPGSVRKAMAALAIGGALAASGAGVANAVSVGGGTWYYGTDDGRVWSNYYHGSSCHGASVQGTVFVRVTGVPGGYWAKASAPDRWYAVDHSYWHTC